MYNTSLLADVLIFNMRLHHTYVWDVCGHSGGI